MGNNAAFTAFEATVIAVYNYGILDQKLLSELMEPYRGVDIEEVVIKTFNVKLPQRPDIPKEYAGRTPKQNAENEAYYELKAELFFDITNAHGWA